MPGKFKQRLVAGFLTVTLLVPSLAAAELGSQTVAANYCHDFGANLEAGVRGGEVPALHRVLQLEQLGADILQVELDQNWFGGTTARAVAAFQEKYADDILKPLNLTQGTGAVGASTRAKLNALYGCPASPGTAVTGMWLESSYLELKTGGRATVRALAWYAPPVGSDIYGQNGNLVITSSQASVAAAEMNQFTGLATIQAKSPGTANLVFHPAKLPASDTSKDKRLTVRVVNTSATVARVEVSQTSVTLSANQTATLSATVRWSDNSTSPGVTIVSSDPNVASGSADAFGQITISAGDPFTDPNVTGELMSAVLTVHPSAAGTDTSRDARVAVTVNRSSEGSDYNQLPEPESPPEVPAYIAGLFGDRTSASLSAAEQEEVAGYYLANAGIFPASFIPGSLMAEAMDLGGETPDSTNGLAVKSIVRGYEYRDGRYWHLFQVPGVSAVGSRLSNPSNAMTIGLGIAGGAATAAAVAAQFVGMGTAAIASGATFTPVVGGIFIPDIAIGAVRALALSIGWSGITPVVGGHVLSASAAAAAGITNIGVSAAGISQVSVTAHTANLFHFNFSLVKLKALFLHPSPTVIVTAAIAGAVMLFSHILAVRKRNHQKVDDTIITNDIMPKIRTIVDTYNSNRAPYQEEEQDNHDRAVMVARALFDATAAYFKLKQSADSQRGYVDGFIRTMDQTLTERLAGFDQGLAALQVFKDGSNRRGAYAGARWGMVLVYPDGGAFSETGRGVPASIAAAIRNASRVATVTRIEFRGSAPPVLEDLIELGKTKTRAELVGNAALLDDSFKNADGSVKNQSRIPTTGLRPGSYFAELLGLGSDTPGDGTRRQTVLGTSYVYSVGANAWSVTPAGTLVITIAPTIENLPPGREGEVYSPAVFRASGGEAPYIWTLASGSLPGGLFLIGDLNQPPIRFGNAALGDSVLWGQPVRGTKGFYSFTLRVKDKNNITAEQSYRLEVAEGPSVPGVITLEDLKRDAHTRAYSNAIPNNLVIQLGDYYRASGYPSFFLPGSVVAFMFSLGTTEADPLPGSDAAQLGYKFNGQAAVPYPKRFERQLASGAVSVSLTVNGGEQTTVRPGQNITYAWSATGAASAASNYTADGADCPGGIGRAGEVKPWVANTLSGTVTATAQNCQVGRTYTITYRAQNASGGVASKSITVKVIAASAPNPNPNPPVIFSPAPSQPDTSTPWAPAVPSGSISVTLKASPRYPASDADWSRSITTSTSPLTVSAGWEVGGIQSGMQYVVLLWCNQNDAGTGYQSWNQPDRSFNTLYSGSPTAQSASNVCRYAAPGTYSLKILIGAPDLNGKLAESRATVVLTSPSAGAAAGTTTFFITPPTNQVAVGFWSSPAMTAWYDSDGTGSQSPRNVSASAAWSSDNPEIAQAGSNGNIKGIKEGETLIRAGYSTGGQTYAASARITVGRASGAAAPATPSAPATNPPSVSSSATCRPAPFNRNLGVGTTGDDVLALRKLLAQEGFDVSLTSQDYDEDLASVVSGFQLRYRADILGSSQNGTGYVGPRTRAKLNSLPVCGVAACHQFQTNLGIGAQGIEIEYLRRSLTALGFPPSSESDSRAFDEPLASAVSDFQLRYRAEILAPAGLTNVTGYLGGRTRAKLNSLSWCVSGKTE
ncbi:MAG: peptidoglycan-binding protein [Candidatus Liptonbacteria bacterium]|nr:peptidoglycan-binding protein [Candidatus Liptonbacteria bacterium]